MTKEEIEQGLKYKERMENNLGAIARWNKQVNDEFQRLIYARQMEKGGQAQAEWCHILALKETVTTMGVALEESMQALWTIVEAQNITLREIVMGKLPEMQAQYAEIIKAAAAKKEAMQ